MAELTDSDRAYVRRAIDLAYAAVEDGNRPFAAVLVGADGEVLMEGCNISVKTGDPLNHAEMNVLRAAHLRHGPEKIDGGTLYINGEPCTMCAGAILRYGIARVVFGLREADLMQYMTRRPGVVSYPSAPIFAIAGRVDVVAGVLADDAKRAFELYVAKGRF